MDPGFAILERWRESDCSAGESLFERHFPATARFFRNRADDALEDLVQRTLLACVEGKDRFSGRSSFRSFLFGIADNLLREHYRTSRKHTMVSDVDEVSLHDTCPRASTLLDELGGVLTRASERLGIGRKTPRTLALDFDGWARIS